MNEEQLVVYDRFISLAESGDLVQAKELLEQMKSDGSLDQKGYEFYLGQYGWDKTQQCILKTFVRELLTCS